MMRSSITHPPRIPSSAMLWLLWLVLATTTVVVQAQLPDTEACLDAWKASDANQDGRLSLAEYTTFIDVYSPYDGCPNIGGFGYVLETPLVDVFDRVRCACVLYEDDAVTTCCETLALPAVYDNDVGYIDRVCTGVATTLRQLCDRSSATATPTTSPTAVPTPAPTPLPTLAIITAQPSDRLPLVPLDSSREVTNDNSKDDDSQRKLTILLATLLPGLVVVGLLLGVYLAHRQRRQRQHDDVWGKHRASSLVTKGRFDDHGELVTDPTETPSEDPIFTSTSMLKVLDSLDEGPPQQDNNDQLPVDQASSSVDIFEHSIISGSDIEENIMRLSARPEDLPVSMRPTSGGSDGSDQTPPDDVLRSTPPPASLPTQPTWSMVKNFMYGSVLGR